MFVTTEIPRTRMPMCRAAMTSCTVDMPARSPPSDAHEPDLRRRLELRPEPGRVDALAQLDTEPLGGLPRTRPQLGVVRIAHVHEARPERLVVRADERGRSLQVHVIRDEDEQAGPVVGVDPACRVRHDERANPEPTEHPHAERNPIGGDALVEVRTPAHDRDRHAAERPEHERPGMSHRSRDGPAGNVLVRDLDTRVELVREPAEPAAEHDTDERLERRLLSNPRDGLVQAHADPSATRLS